MHRYAPDTAEYYLDQPKHYTSSVACGDTFRRQSKGILLQRTKTVIAGDHLDADIYPVLDWQYSREVKARRKTPEQMRKANLERALRYFTQLGNLNFGNGDLFVTLTMAEECSFEEFQRIKRNFFSRLRARFKRAGVPFEYLGTVESTNEGKRHHIHMILRGGVIDRDELEKLWRLGTANAKRVQIQFEDKGVEGLCRYMTNHKDTQEKLMAHKWFASKGLKKPRATYNDSKFSRAAAARIEKAVREDARKEFEKRYPGWRLVDYSVRYSDFLPGVYIHAHMRRYGDRVKS